MESRADTLVKVFYTWSQHFAMQFWLQDGANDLPAIHDSQQIAKVTCSVFQYNSDAFQVCHASLLSAVYTQAFHDSVPLDVAHFDPSFSACYWDSSYRCTCLQSTVGSAVCLP